MRESQALMRCSLGFVVLLTLGSGTANAVEAGARADSMPTSVEGFELPNTLSPGSWYIKATTQDLGGTPMSPRLSYGLAPGLELTMSPSLVASMGFNAMEIGLDLALKRRLLRMGFCNLSILGGGGIRAHTYSTHTWHSDLALPVSTDMGGAGVATLCPRWRTWHGGPRPDSAELGLAYQRTLYRNLELWVTDNLIWAYGPNLDSSMTPDLPWREFAAGLRTSLVAGVHIDVTLFHLRTTIWPGPWTSLPLFQVSVYVGNSGPGLLDAPR